MSEIIKISALTPPETIPKLFRYLPLEQVAYSYSPVKTSPKTFFEKIDSLKTYLEKQGFGLMRKSSNLGYRDLNFVYGWNSALKTNSLEDDYAIVSVKDYTQIKNISNKEKIQIGYIVISSENYGNQKRFLTLKRKAVSMLERVTGNRLKEISVSIKRGECVEWYA